MDRSARRPAGALRSRSVGRPGFGEAGAAEIRQACRDRRASRSVAQRRGPDRMPRLATMNEKETLMKVTVHLGLILAIAAAGAGCGKSEKPGPATVSEVSSSAPAATPDPHPPIAMMN